MAPRRPTLSRKDPRRVPSGRATRVPIAVSRYPRPGPAATASATGSRITTSSRRRSIRPFSWSSWRLRVTHRPRTDRLRCRASSALAGSGCGSSLCLEQLKKQHGWGDLGDAEYQAQRDAVRTALAALPDDDRIRSFDAYRARLLALPEAIAVASPARRGKSSVGSWSSGSSCGTARSRRSTGPLRPGRSSKDSGSAPKGIRTPDLHLERVAS